MRFWDCRCSSRCSATHAWCLSEGFKRKVPIIGIGCRATLQSFHALSHVFADLPLGLAYAIWTSAAVALTAVVSRIIWKEKFNAKKIAGIALIIFGVACLRLGRCK